MIFEAILGFAGGAVNILLSPLTIINISLDLVDSIPVVMNFLKLGIYILPWDNLVPLLAITAGVGLFRLVIAIVKTIMNLIPFV